jgi:hypothetical protein
MIDIQQPRAFAKVAYPEYRPRCYRDLERVLGASDATIEWIEVGSRNLKREHDAGGDARTDAIAAECGVRVNAFNWPSLGPRLARLQIVTVCQYIEWFLDSFRREFPRSVAPRHSEDDLLKYTLNAYCALPNQAAALECSIIEYYCSVRNHFLHSVESAPRKPDARLAEDLRARLASSRYATLGAPNSYAALAFDDFVLASRAVKNFSRILCTHAEPRRDELQVAIRSDLATIRRWRGRAQSPRLVESVATYIRRRFGFPTSAAGLAYDMLANGLLA